MMGVVIHGRVYEFASQSKWLVIHYYTRPMLNLKPGVIQKGNLVDSKLISKRNGYSCRLGLKISLDPAECYHHFQPTFLLIQNIHMHADGVRVHT